jgi:hypothetical protein
MPVVAFKHAMNALLISVALFIALIRTSSDWNMMSAAIPSMKEG